MKVTVRLFGHLAERAGRPSVQVEIGGSTAGEALDAVRRLLPALPLAGVKLALNDDYAGPGTMVRSGDVISLLPPVGGG